MIITILMLLAAIGMLAGLAKTAQLRALGPDGRRAKKIQKLERKRDHQLRCASDSRTDPMERSLWAIAAQATEYRIKNLQTLGKVKQLETSVTALQSQVISEINPEATPLELELGVGPSAGSALAQITIDRIDNALQLEQLEQQRKNEAIALAVRKQRAADGLCCRFCLGEDHKADDCIENPAVQSESIARQEPLWSARDQQTRLAREAEHDAVQTWEWGQSEPVSDDIQYRARHIAPSSLPGLIETHPVRINAGRVDWRDGATKQAKMRGLEHLYNNGTISAGFFEREIRKLNHGD
jgi:hypothetical protein